LRYEESDEEWMDTSSLLGKHSFQQQISTSSNTDSDFKIFKIEKD